jgi:hypothetical protein
MEKYFKPLEYHNNIMDRLKPRTLNGWLGLTKPTTINLAHWAESADCLDDNPIKHQAMMDLFG